MRHFILGSGIAGQNMAGVPARYPGSPILNTIRIFDMDPTTCGPVNPPEDAGIEIVQDGDANKGHLGAARGYRRGTRGSRSKDGDTNRDGQIALDQQDCEIWVVDHGSMGSFILSPSHRVFIGAA